MLNIESLQVLYQQGKYQECLEGTNLFLLFNNENADALLVKGKCEYQIASISADDTNDEDIAVIYKAAYDSFTDVLKFDPNNDEARLYVVYIDIFIARINLPESIALCDQLAESMDPMIRLKAITYRCEAKYITSEFDQAIADIDRLIDLSKDQFKEDRVLQDHELGLLYLKKADIFLEQKDDPEHALKMFAEAIKYRHNDVMIYCRIANVAFDNNHFDLGGEALKRGLLMESQDSGEEILAVYVRADQFVRQGINSKSMIESVFVALRIFAERLDCDTIEMLSIAKKYIKIFPDWYIPYNYAGAALYDAESYGEALPYLQKNLQLGGSAYGMMRLIISAYIVNNTLPDIEKWPDAPAVDYYNAGVFFFEFEETNRDETVSRKLLQLRAEFYRKSYDGFYEYFYNNKGSADAGDIHIFAMCCNNFGIALRELGENENAVEVHRLGYALSPFWEQLYTCGLSLINLGRYHEAIDALNEAVGYGEDYIDFPSYIDIKGCLLEATYELGNDEDTWDLLKQTETEYDSFMDNYSSGLSKEELFVLSERYIVVQNVRSSLLKETNIEDAIKIWQDQASKYPEDNSNWFMLMQNYYQAKDYKQCIACADNYELIKKDAIKLESKHKLHFMRGMSYLRLENFVKAKEDFNNLLKACKLSNEAQESIIFDANLHLAECCFGLHEWKECMDFAWNAIAIYNNNGWRWDDQRIQVTLLYADACKAIGEKKAAIGTINTVLEAFPNDKEALRRRKEWSSTGFFSFLKRK